ncbi:MAG TPA: SpoIIE family protein phosphatase [Terriglobales bacterium]|nr:SpoIIE family protein phosphatase [Terriglobales bacterium]
MLTLLKRLTSRQSPEAKCSQAEAPKLQNAEIAAAFCEVRQGGEFCDFIRVRNDRVLFGLLDVAGTVETTRAIVAAAQQTFRTRGAQLFSQEGINEPDAMSTLCHDINRAILSSARGVRSCPAFIGCYNEDLGIVCYLNAGHTPGLLTAGEDVSELRATTLPLGLFSHVTTDAPMVALPPGAVMLLVSRGVVEGRRKREEFGLGRVKQYLQNGAPPSANEICTGVLDTLRQYVGRALTYNDVTTLALVRGGT